MRLSDRTILVTGAARGIGAGIVRACRDAGARVMATDIDAGALAAAFEGEENIRTAAMDVGDRASVESALAGLDWAVIDGVVNNAAMLDGSHVAEIAEERWRRILDVNLGGAMRVTQVALPRLRRSGAPAVVNTASVQGLFAQPNSAAYATAKGGLLNLTRVMAVDLAPYGIRANAVAPGFIDTAMALAPDGSHSHESRAFREGYLDSGRIPLRRPGKVEDCTGAFLFLLSDDSAYVTGQTLVVDGGLSATY